MTTTGQTHSGADQPLLPGRLGDPGRSLKTDPRADPRLVAALAEFGLDEAAPPAAVTAESPLGEILEFWAGAETGLQEIFDTFFTGLPEIKNVERRTEVIKGADDNDIRLYIHQPKDASGPLPCVYHIHGGGMAILEATGSQYARWRDELSALGMVVVGVEFRNAAGKLGNHPFPAGLNDCMSGLQWTFDNKAALGIGKIVVSGESGGGNLALAVGLQAKKDDKLEQIDGVYAMCPYISNAWANKIQELPSLYECDGYFINCSATGAMAVAYDPAHENDKNPLCWPYFAETRDLQGLPPHAISVNQLDPLRDEGLKYYQMLASAGVSVYSRTMNGTSHVGDMCYPKVLPEAFGATIRDIKGFADSL